MTSSAKETQQLSDTDTIVLALNKTMPSSFYLPDNWYNCQHAGFIGFKFANSSKFKPSNDFALFNITTDKLGFGSYGTVFKLASYHVLSLFKKMTYCYKQRAVKVVPISRVDALIKEYTMMKLAGHLGVKCPVICGDQIMMVMKCCPGQSLLELLNETQLSLPQKKQLTRALLSALHRQVISKGLCHRDIKLENIMVDLNNLCQVNIIDYGFAELAGNVKDSFPGSLPYVAPELWHHQQHDAAVDIFAMARIIHLIWSDDNSSFSEQPPAFHYSHAMICHRTVYIEGHVAMTQLLQAMLHPVATMRPSVLEALNFFDTHMMMDKTRVSTFFASSVDQRVDNSAISYNGSFNLR